MQIDIRGNTLLECPDPEIVNPMVQVVCDGADPGIGGATATTLRGVPLNDDTDILVTAPSLPDPRAGESGGSSVLSAGAIAGIVVAVAVAVLIAVAVATVALRRYKEGKREAWTSAMLDEGMPSTASADYAHSTLP